MAVLFRWLVRLTGALILLGVLAVVVIYFLLSRSLPDYNKVLPVAYRPRSRSSATIPTCRIFLASRMRMCSLASAMPMRRTGCGR